MLKALRARHPWPNERPALEPRIQGWFHGRSVLEQYCGEQVSVILELGTWLGLSADWFAKSCPNAHIICVDHWAGDADIARTGIPMPDLPAQWYSNMWQWRERMTAVTADMVDGIREVAAEKIEPDLVYIDGAHDVESVRRDLSAVLDHFPKARIVGDDWTFASVREAVTTVLRARRVLSRLRPEGEVWSLDLP